VTISVPAKNDPKKTWNLINQLSSRNVSKRSTVNRVDFNDAEVTDTHEIAEAFNTHFTEAKSNPITDVNPIIILY
jgi:hypothetical protein